MAKEINKILKLVIPAGQATPAPPIGPTLSPYGLNMQDFCNQFNDKTRPQAGILTPVILTIYKDRSFKMEIKTPPTSELIRRAINIKKGSATPNLKKVGKITRAQIKEIVATKMVDFNTDDANEAMKIVEGSARQMGVEVVE
jgi:large subunit ribosomal protein L11